MKSIVDKITKYLTKQNHQNVFTIFLNGYNNNDILVRFDFVKSMSAFKVVWIDLNYIDKKKFEQYINMQIMTKFLANRLIDIVDNINTPSGEEYNDNILGDRVNIYINSKNGMFNYNFDRFLPEKWKFLADLLVIIFSYLPRNMECFLNEMFGKLDNLEDAYNSKKPVKINIKSKSDLKKYFKPVIMDRGKKYFEDGKVLFLDKIDNRYIALVEGSRPYAVIVDQVNDDYVLLWCNCQYKGFCKHVYAVIEAINNGFSRKFYKVRRVNEKSILENITNVSYELSIGVNEKNIILLTNDGELISEPIMSKGKCRFEIIEDDDDLGLSKYFEEMK